MKTPYLTLCRSLLIAVGLAVATTAHAKIERVVEKSFSVSPGGTLRVETEGGSIRVQPSSDSMVKITAKQKIRASSESEADELLKKLTLTFDAQGADVTTTANSRNPRWACVGAISRSKSILP